MRLIVKDQHGNLRIVGRGKAAVGRNMFALPLEFRFLRSPRFSGNPVACNITAFCRTGCCVFLQNFTHSAGSFRRNDLTFWLCADGFDNIAVAVKNLGHDMRLNQITAVRYSAASRYHLNRCDFVGLADGNLGQIQRGHAAFGTEDAAGFPGQVDSGFTGKTECAEIFGK